MLKKISFCLSLFSFLISSQEADAFFWKKKQPAPIVEEPPKSSLGILPSAVPCQQDGAKSGPYFTGSFLYWQAKMGGLEYAAKNKGPSEPKLTNIQFNTHTIQPDFAWQSGYRLELGYNTTYDGWDIEAAYTYFLGKFTPIKKKVHSQIVPEGEGIVPLHYYQFFNILSFFPTFQFPVYRAADGNWKMHFNTLDAEIGRRFFLNKSIQMRFHGGIKSCWINQNYSVEYGDGNTAGIPPLFPAPRSVKFLQSNVRYRSKTWGLGPKLGFDSKWKVWGGWNIIADGSFSLLYSFYDVKRNQKDLDLFIVSSRINTTAGLEVFTSKLQDDFSSFLPVFQVSLGTDWGTCLGSKEKYFLLFGIIYETQLWWELNQIPRFIDTFAIGEAYNVNGNLQIQGLVAKLQLDF